MTVTRCNPIPPVPTSTARLGYNCQNTFKDTNALAAAKAGGATIVRWQPAWGSTAPDTGVESYSSPGTYSLGSPTETALAWCGANGMQVIAVCGFGPPWHRFANALTVGAAGALIGAYAVPISSGLGSVVTPTDYVDKAATQITGKGGYYGSLIDSVDTGAGTLTLASALTVNLNSGDTLNLNRLLYPAPDDQTLTNSNLLAYWAYLKFVAGRIAANGVTGWVAIWNEPPWSNDKWGSGLGKFYDTPGSHLADDRMKAFLRLALQQSSPPAVGIGVINGATDKSGGSSILLQSGINPTAPQVAASGLAVESVHPYGNSAANQGNLPEQYAWDSNSVVGNTWQLLNPTIDSGSNFGQLSRTQFLNASLGLSMIATECGGGQADETRKAICDLRRVISNWGNGMLTVVYALAENSAYDVTTKSGSPATYTAKTSYTGLSNLMTLVQGLGSGTGASWKVPAVVGYQDQIWPLITVPVYGGSKAILFVWQRTGADTGTAWDTLSTPATYNADFWIPPGTSVSSVTDVLTGSTLTTSTSGQRLNVSGIGESPAAILVA